MIRSNDMTPIAHFNSLVYAFYIPSILLIVSAISFAGERVLLYAQYVLFSVSAYFLLGDKERFDIAMGYKQETAKVTILTTNSLNKSPFDVNENL